MSDSPARPSALEKSPTGISGFDAMQGDLGATSTAGTGSAFTVTGPRVIAPVPEGR